LFAVMPVHGEAVAWITGKVDLLPTAFYLATFCAFARYRAGRGRIFWWLALALYLPGLFTKEILITLPALLVAFDWLVTPALRGPDHSQDSERARWTTLLLAVLPFALAAGVFLALRAVLFDSAARAGRLTWPRLELFLVAQPGKAAALLVPFDVESRVGALLALAVLGVLFGAAWTTWRRPGTPATYALLAFFGLAWYGLTLLPLLVTYSSARHLYLPSCGIAAALALLLLPPQGWQAAHASRLRLASLGLLVVAYGVQLVQDNQAWTTAGAVSRQLRAGIAAALERTPAQSTALLSGLPITEGDLVVWKFALPFALQPPFVERDLYAGRRLLAPHGASSQPLEHWWRDTRGTLVTLLQGDDAQRLDMWLLHWNARRGVLSARAAHPLRGLLRRQALRALGAAPQDVEQLDPQRAEHLIGALAEALRHSPAVP
jgi:hypothetical protein